ncbi:MAG: HAD family hydrolase [Lachnospiraceae bacterium]
MIKNIVFDMGKVLVNYDAMYACEALVADPADREQVCTAVFISPEWILLDLGVISEERALKQMCDRLPERLHEEARACLEQWHLYCMRPRADMGELVRMLKGKGYGIYLLSNASNRLPAMYKDVIPAVECFDGVMFSAAEKCMKPQKEIYQRFFERFHVKPEESFFVDDLESNIEGAKDCGMDGYCFADGDIDKLRTKLEEFDQ